MGDDPYAALGASAGASPDELRRALGATGFREVGVLLLKMN